MIKLPENFELDRSGLHVRLKREEYVEDYIRDYDEFLKYKDKE